MLWLEGSPADSIDVLQLVHPKLATAVLVLDITTLSGTLLLVDPAIAMMLGCVLFASVVLVPLAYWRFRLDADRRLKLCVAQCHVELHT